MNQPARHSHLTAFHSAPVSTPAERKCREIVSHVAHEFGVKISDIECARRGSQKVAFARQVAMYLAHVGLGFGFAQVGACFRRDRTTVSYVCRVVEDKRDDIWFDCRTAAFELACHAAGGGLR